MAIINCSECGKEVSDKAEVCPHCGNPLHVKDEKNPTTIQVTQKRWKACKFIGILLIVLGGLALMGSIGSGNTGAQALGSASLVTGIILYIVARLGAWWTTG